MRVKISFTELKEIIIYNIILFAQKTRDVGEYCFST